MSTRTGDLVGNTPLLKLPLMDSIEKTNDLSGDDEKALIAAVEDFKKNGAY